MVDIFCRRCGAKLEASDETCPKCSSGDRNVFGADEGEGMETLKLNAKDASGFVRRKLTTRSKRGVKTGRKAEERIEIDRTSDKETKILHRVLEQCEEGKWEEVHHHENVSPAKRRKR